MRLSLGNIKREDPLANEIENNKLDPLPCHDFGNLQH